MVLFWIFNTKRPEDIHRSVGVFRNRQSRRPRSFSRTRQRSGAACCRHPWPCTDRHRKRKCGHRPRGVSKHVRDGATTNPARIAFANAVWLLSGAKRQRSIPMERTRVPNGTNNPSRCDNQRKASPVVVGYSFFLLRVLE